jgi:hypothetical protein
VIFYEVEFLQIWHENVIRKLFVEQQLQRENVFEKEKLF